MQLGSTAHVQIILNTFGQYTCCDLIGIGGSSTNYHYSGALSRITVSNGKRLTIIHGSDDQHGTGKFQIWLKAQGCKLCGIIKSTNEHSKILVLQYQS